MLSLYFQTYMSKIATCPISGLLRSPLWKPKRRAWPAHTSGLLGCGKIAWVRCEDFFFPFKHLIDVDLDFVVVYLNNLLSTTHPFGKSVGYLRALEKHLKKQKKDAMDAAAGEHAWEWRVGFTFWSLGCWSQLKVGLCSEPMCSLIHWEARFWRWYFATI